MNHNLLANKEQIKRSLLNKAAKVWNLSSPDYLDPLVSLLMDSMSYELSKVGQSLTAFNSRILEDLASILVPGERLTASPAHAVMKAIPAENNVTIGDEHQFYIPNALKRITMDKIQGDLYFSAIKEVKLLNAEVKWMVHDRHLYQIVDGLYKEKITRTQSSDQQFADGEVWIGLEPLTNHQLIDKLDLFLDVVDGLNVNDSFRFNDEIDFEILLQDGQFLKMSLEDKDLKVPSFTHGNVFEKIETFYENKFIRRVIKDQKFKISQEVLFNYPEIFKRYFNAESLELFNAPCLWVKIQFPEIFDRKFIEGVKIFPNCFVVTNKRFSKSYHDISRSGTILPIETLPGEELLTVTHVSDQRDEEYKPLINKVESTDVKGTYKVYYGRLESFDLQNGRLMLEQLAFKVREEGNSFSAMAQDTILVHLEELYDDLEVLENKIDQIKSNYDANFNSYVLTFPHHETEWMEYEYWTTNGELANNLPIGTEFQQYRFVDLLDPSSIRLLTASMGGRVAPQGPEKVGALRELVLSKDRLVSKSDIKNFINNEIGHLIEKSSIEPGCKIFPDKKKGLVRVTNICLYPKKNILSLEQWQVICSGIEKQIRRKAIRGHQYYVVLKEDRSR